MGVSSRLIQLTEMKMGPSTFLLITLLCVLPPPPVACKKNMLKHLHKEIHQISDALFDDCNFILLAECTVDLAEIIVDCIKDGGSAEDKVKCIFDRTKKEESKCLPCVYKIICTE